MEMTVHISHLLIVYKTTIMPVLRGKLKLGEAVPLSTDMACSTRVLSITSLSLLPIVNFPQEISSLDLEGK